MIKQRTFNFQERLMMSEGISDKHPIEQIIRCGVPGVVAVERASRSDDRNGIDYWATLESGRKLGIDAKVREVDWWFHHRAEDDVALETYSILKRDEKGTVIGGTVGWTRNAKKQTDWILFVWKETGRYLLLPFPQLCDIFTVNWEQWRKQYRTEVQSSTGENNAKWESECVFVPRLPLLKMVCESFKGRHAIQEEDAA